MTAAALGEKVLQAAYLLHREDVRQRDERARKRGRTAKFFSTTHSLNLSEGERREFAFWSVVVKTKGPRGVGQNDRDVDARIMKSRSVE